MPNSGFESDIGTFTAWALDLAERGSGSFYASAGFADYPPGYLYVLWLIGGVGHMLADLTGGDAVAITTTLIKLPPMLADIAVGIALYWIARRWRAPRLDAHRIGLTAAALYVFNPVTWYDSAIWGQTDAFGALVLVLTVAALVRGNSEGATVLSVLAAVIKPQFGVVLIPLVGIVLLRRHLLKPGTNPRNRILAPPAAARWLAKEEGPLRLVSSAVLGLIVMLVVITPFSLSIPGFVEQMAKTAGGYQFLSVNGYNPWAMIGSDGNQGIAWGGAWSWNPDTVPLLGPVPGVMIGAVLLIVGFAIGLARVGWRDDRRSILLVGLFLALCFFILPTRVHERYMFPIFGLLPLLAAVDRRWLWATVAMSTGAFINLHGVLTTDIYASPNLEHLPLGDFARSTPGVLLSIALNVGGFAYVAWMMRRSAADERDPYASLARPRQIVPSAPGEPVAAPVPALPVSVSPAAMPAHGSRSLSAGAIAAAAVAGRAGGAMDQAALSTSSIVASDSEPDADIDEPPQPPILQNLRNAWSRLVGSASTRRDRSGMLANELPSSRLDRKDLGLIALVFLSTLLLRTYRLEVPYSMHFDEVYHARTAVEFLQNWRYDMPHDIYEFTHPHLAKYGMALGIMALGDNKVTSTRELGINVRDAVIEPRWNPDDNPGERDGDRLYVAGDNEVGVFELSNKQQIATIPGTYEAIAVDEE
ncbi:MAG TPA: hypothetical protein VMZ33_01760, partial [Candidatus Limnocylindrales bacterium]|nr:hypothetical protein [Candidatus Limnocylindrales bacterium]